MSTFQVAGITFARDRSPSIRSLRPVGGVSFEAEPDNAYDSGAVRVMYKGEHIGYVPKGPLQRDCLEVGAGVVSEYLYKGDVDAYPPKGWNSEHNGQLQAVTISLPEQQADNGRVIGGQYIRVTSFLSYFDPYGGGDGLIKWAFDQADTYEGYREALNKTAEDGTAMHDAIEQYFTDGTRSDLLPAGFDAFLKKYEPEPESMEVRFYDNELMVTGQYDFLGTVKINGVRVKAIVDWKSSKKVSMKHKIQASVYAKNMGADAGLVVAFGAENKQRYSAGCVTLDKIESNYMAMRHVKAAMDAVGVWVKEYWDG